MPAYESAVPGSIPGVVLESLGISFISLLGKILLGHWALLSLSLQFSFPVQLA